jgi:Tfp pilus assembly protein PilE
MSFTTIGLIGVVAAVALLAAAALVVQRRERRREAQFDDEVADLREEMRALEARTLYEDTREAPAIQIRKARLSESLRATLVRSAGDRSPAAAS